MAFIGDVNKGVAFNAGYFLASGDEEITRETREISQTGATSANGGKYHKAGEPFPANDGTCEGLLYEDVDVTVGNMPCSVVTGNAVVIEERIPLSVEQLTASCLEALGNRNIRFVKEAEVTRPYN